MEEPLLILDSYGLEFAIPSRNDPRWTSFCSDIQRKESVRVFFTPLIPFGKDSNEEEHRDDYTIPQKVHYHSNWKRDQDAVHWIKLSRAQDQGLRFWQTKSHAIIVHNPMPADCIYRGNLSERV